MIFCKFDKSISMSPHEEAVEHHFIAAPSCAKRANQYGSHVGFCVDKHIVIKMLLMEIYSIFHDSEKTACT